MFYLGIIINFSISFGYFIFIKHSFYLGITSLLDLFILTIIRHSILQEIKVDIKYLLFWVFELLRLKVSKLTKRQSNFYIGEIRGVFIMFLLVIYLLSSDYHLTIIWLSPDYLSCDFPTILLLWKSCYYEDHVIMKINFYTSLLCYVILFNIMNPMFNYYYLIFTAYLLWVFSVATPS